MKKSLYILLTLIFITFAVVQYNDPDKGIWISLYLIPVYILYKKYFQTADKPLLLVIALIYLLWAISQFPPEWEGVTLNTLGMKTINIELGRESLGLGFVALVLFGITVLD